MLERLPSEMLTMILKKVKRTTALSCAQLNQRLFNICDKHRLYKPTVETLEAFKSEKNLELYMKLDEKDIEKRHNYLLEDKSLEGSIMETLVKVKSIKLLLLRNVDLTETTVNALIAGLDPRHIETLSLEESRIYIPLEQFLKFLRRFKYIRLVLLKYAGFTSSDFFSANVFGELLPKMQYVGWHRLAVVLETPQLTDKFLFNLRHYQEHRLLLGKVRPSWSLDNLQKFIKEMMLSDKKFQWELGVIHERRISELYRVLLEPLERICDVLTYVYTEVERRFPVMYITFYARHSPGNSICIFVRKTIMDSPIANRFVPEEYRV